jgi:hypothetical protein
MARRECRELLDRRNEAIEKGGIAPILSKRSGPEHPPGACRRPEVGG